MVDCPTCGNEFDNERGMKIHHYRVHDESIAKEEADCDNCGCVFEYYPCSKPGKYCEECVEDTNYRAYEHLQDGNGSGKENPNWDGGKFISCEECGDKSWKSPEQIEKSDHHFCSDECFREWQSKQYVGEGNPNWKGGYEGSYGKGWWRKKKKALERDNYTCQKCGSTDSVDNRRPDVHHIKPVREFENKEDAHFLENLITLCRSCHIEVEYSDEPKDLSSWPHND